jgi:hypothetical protein
MVSGTYSTSYGEINWLASLGDLQGIFVQRLYIDLWDLTKVPTQNINI